MSAQQPIGVFDSGIGGLSVLQALLTELPREHFVYLADNGHAPYGEKSDLFVRQRSLAIADHLIREHQIKALVVACNTATAAAIQELRQRHPHLPLIGVEPAIKPAAQLTRTGRVGVMATRGTVASEKFQRLLASLQGTAEFSVCACNGLALAIEQSTLPGHQETASAEVERLLRQYTAQLAPFGQASGQIDTLVLGCTHYVFAQETLVQLLGKEVQLVSTGEPVARQTRRLLETAHLLHAAAAPLSPAARLKLLTTGDLAGLQAAADRFQTQLDDLEDEEQASPYAENLRAQVAILRQHAKTMQQPAAADVEEAWEAWLQQGGEVFEGELGEAMRTMPPAAAPSRFAFTPYGIDAQRRERVLRRVEEARPRYAAMPTYEQHVAFKKLVDRWRSR